MSDTDAATEYRPDLPGCDHCGAKIRARDPRIHALLCVKECTAAYRCGASVGGRGREYCEFERNHEGSHKLRILMWSD